MNATDQATSIIIAVMVATIVILMLATAIFGTIFGKEKEPEICEDVGGEYIVIDQEYSATLKRTVDIYGCVMKDE